MDSVVMGIHDEYAYLCQHHKPEEVTEELCEMYDMLSVN